MLAVIYNYYISSEDHCFSELISYHVRVCCSCLHLCQRFLITTFVGSLLKMSYWYILADDIERKHKI